VAAGEIGALGQLYDLHAAGLLRFLRRVAPPGEAEDLMQATFLRAVAIADTFDPEATSARPWLFSLASRLVQGKKRALGRLSAALVNFARFQLGAHASAPESGRDLQRALLELSEHKRVAFVLTEIEGFTAEQVATMVGVPVGTVWTRLHHARRELRARLGDVL
jgi:RNA polymerase sigma-70 factor (ECF subfamily)